MWKWIAIPAALGGFAALSVWNYRRFMPKPQSVGTEDHAVEVKPVPVRAGGHQLYGELLLPKDKTGPLPTVICCHGFGSSYKLCKNTMGMCLAKSGFAVYCFDFYGGSKHSKSGGTMLEMSIFTEREDLDAVIDAISRRPEVDRENLFLLGESQGGCVAGITAPRHLDQLKAMVLYYPAFCIPDDARKKFKTAEDIPAVSKTFKVDVGKVYNEKLLDYDVFTDIQGFDKPVLILHGDADQVVDVSYGQRAAEVYPNATFELFPGETHGFTGKGKLKAAKLTFDFLTEQVSGPFETTSPPTSPYLPGWEYVPDGEPHVFGDRLYVFGSHDKFGGKKFCENDYVGWSAPLSDLSRWRYEGVTYRSVQDPDNRDGKLALWAPDVTRGPDGRYYLFYCLADHPRLGVVVCDAPAGRYEFLGCVRHPDGTLLGARENDVWPFDPAVFVDDDGSVHLYAGQAPQSPRIAKWKAKSQKYAFHAELSPDMLTLKTEPKILLPNVLNSAGTGFEGHEFFEASSLRKFDGRYYFIYSSVLSHELCWTVSHRPDGPFRFGGTLVSNGDIGLKGPVPVSYNGKPDRRVKNYIGNTHGSVEKINGQYYVFYHRHTHRTMCCRQGCAAPIEMDGSGNFHQAEMVSSGLGGPLPGTGRYEARIACQLRAREGCVYSVHPMVQNKKHPAFTQDGPDGLGGTQYIENLRDGAAAGYKYFDFDGTNRIAVTVRGSGGKVVVRAAAEGPVVAEIAVTPANTWTEFSTPMKPLSGVLPLYFTYQGGKSIDFLAFALDKEA